MSVRIALLIASALTLPAQAADFALPPPVPRPALVPAAPPPLSAYETVRPLIELEGFWIRVRQCQTAAEVGAQIDARYRGFPLVFQGIDTRIGEFRRVTILRAYRRPEDEGIALPAVTFDLVSDGVPRTVTVPLWSGVRVIP